VTHARQLKGELVCRGQQDLSVGADRNPTLDGGSVGRQVSGGAAHRWPG
jgi:hypothetical protein